MAHDALETVKLRNNFYRDSYRKVVSVLIVASLTIFLLVAVIFYLIAYRPSPKYFATSADGKIIRLVPLDQPTLDSNSIRQWASKAAIAAYTYNFVNWRQQFNSVEHYFTPAGWRAFLQQLEKSGNLKSVQEKKLLVTAIPKSVPVVSNEGVINRYYTWRVQVPIIVQYQSQSENFTNNLLVTMTIRRVSTLKQESGIGIQSFVAQTG